MNVRSLIESGKPPKEVVEAVFDDPYATGGWVTPDGELLELHGAGEPHAEIAYQDKEKFGITEEEIQEVVDSTNEDLTPEEAALQLALQKGAVRIRDYKTIFIQGKGSAIEDHVDQLMFDRKYVVSELPEDWKATTGEVSEGEVFEDITLEEFMERYG